MHNRNVYQLVTTVLPKGMCGEAVQQEVGIFTTLKQAKKFMMELVNEADFFCPVYCYSIQILPLDDSLEYQSEREIKIYSPNGKLQISEINMMSCNAHWDKDLNLNIRACIDMGPKKKSYFILSNHWRPGHATKSTRISFLEPKYEFGVSYDKSIWFLNENEKQVLYDFLKTPIEWSSRVGIHNVWQAAIWAFNNEVQADDDSRMLPEDLPIPDYRMLSNE